MSDGFWRVYERDYKRLMIIPLLITVFSLSVIINHYLINGELFSKDISLKGGTSITYYTSEPLAGVNDWAFNQWGKDVSIVLISDPIGGFKGYDFRIGRELSIDEVKLLLNDLVGREVANDEFSMGFQGASIASNFFNEALIIIIISFILMGFVSLYYFRNFVPTITISLSTLFDVINVIAIINLLGESLSVAGIGALLMLVGYSTDSDTLFAVSILKQKKEEINSKLRRTFKTQLTMGLATITTAFIMFSFTNIELIKSIALVLLIGSVSDVINTSFLSSGLLRSYRHWRDSK